MKTVEIGGVWLRINSGENGVPVAEVLVELEGRWVKVIDEIYSPPCSHIVEPSGIMRSPEDTVTR